MDPGSERGRESRNKGLCMIFTRVSETGSSTYLLETAEMRSTASLDVFYSFLLSNFSFSGSTESSLRLVSIFVIVAFDLWLECCKITGPTRK